MIDFCAVPRIDPGEPSQVDLRSATELGKDCSIDGYVYNGFVNIGDGGAVWDGSTPSDEAAVGGRRDCGDGRREETKGSNTHCGRRRYFVSLIDEDVYKKGVFQRLRRRHKVSSGPLSWRGSGGGSKAAAVAEVFL